MLGLARHVRTHLSPDEVFDYLADFRSTRDWDPRAHDARRVEGDGDVGSRYAVDVSFVGRTVPMTYVVTELERPARIAWSGTSGLVHHRDVIHLVPVAGGGTRVDYLVTFVATARAGRLLELLLAPALRRLVDDAADGLRLSLSRPALARPVV